MKGKEEASTAAAPLRAPKCGHNMAAYGCFARGEAASSPAGGCTGPFREMGFAGTHDPPPVCTIRPVTVADGDGG